ncbi:MAG: glycoside hydrolase family 36 protein [Mangrovibacterium sp.]
MKHRIFFLPFLVVLIFLIECCKGSKSVDRERSVSSILPVAEDFLQKLKESPYRMEDAGGNIISGDWLVLERRWSGNICKMTLKNEGKTAVHLSNIILFDISDHNLPPESAVYGEGFQMLHQNGGTLAQRKIIGGYPDNKHYNIPEPHGLPTAYGVLEINTKPGEHLLLGFTSCNRFIGRISFDARQIQISVDAEGLELKPGESWELEDFILLGGNDRGLLFDQLSSEIVKNHPTRKTKAIPTGWCSWYCYGPAVTNKNIEDNLHILAGILPELRYVQIDDGYQPYMGDWLDGNPAYGDLQKTLAAIRAKGFEPAIWVAPFIAESGSRIFKEHPDWFVKDIDGSPLNSAKIGFGGWRSGPWYVLDGTHPEVQKHLRHVFRVMREEWGVNYFKLDANYWGAIHGGVHFDKNATRIEAYRRGMEAILRGCDEQSVILGCNAPMWPSLGLVTAMRTSRDSKREWGVFRKTAYENLNRTWQNGKFWDNDPDCVLLTNDTIFSGKKAIEHNEWLFQATAIHAVGGLILNGDKASLLKDHELTIMKKLLNPTGMGAHFFDTKMETAITDMGDTQYYYFFNWSDTESIDLTVQLKSEAVLTDFWTDQILGTYIGSYTVTNLPPHSAKLIMAKPRNN